MLELILIIAVLIVDQLSKYLTELFIPYGSSIPLIDGVFQLTNVHNTGAAWGILSGGRWLFLALTPLLCIALIFLLIKGRERIGVLGRICVSLLICGAFGNLIDRVVLSYVRDMFDFCLINFPVFNVADSAVTIGAVLLCVDTLFVKEGSIFGALEQMRKPKKKDTMKQHEAQGDE